MLHLILLISGHTLDTTFIRLWDDDIDAMDIIYTSCESRIGIKCILNKELVTVWVIQPRSYVH